MNFKHIKKARELGYRTEADYPDYSSDLLSPYNMLADYEDSCYLKSLIDKLDNREKQIIKYRFYEEKPMTLKEISQIHGRSVERVRDILNYAVEKIGMMLSSDSGETCAFVIKMEEKREQEKERRYMRNIRKKLQNC